VEKFNYRCGLAASVIMIKKIARLTILDNVGG